MDNIELTDGVITIRPLHVAGAEAHFAGNDEENVRWLSGGWGTLDGHRAWIEGVVKVWDAGPKFSFFVFETETGAQVGYVDGDTDWSGHEALTEGQANVAYNIYPAYRRRGYATRAVSLIQEFLAERGVREAVLQIEPAHVASLGVARRAGFVAVRDIVTSKGETFRVHVREIREGLRRDRDE